MSDRIAFVCPRFAEGSTVGGAETLLKMLALRAARAGRHVTFLSTCAKNHFTWENEWEAGERHVDGLRVIRFPVDADRDVGEFLRVQDKICRRQPVSESEEQTWLRNSVNSRTLCEHLERESSHYDRIVMGPYLFGLIYHAAMVNPERTLLVPCLHDEPFAYLRTMRRLFGNVHGILFNTPPERELALSLYDVEPDKTSVVGMGIDAFETDPARFATQQSIREPYIIYCGRREPLKGTPLLVDYLHAFRNRTGRDIKLVFTGSGHVDIPCDLAPHVIDAGFVSEQEKHDAMAGAVAFCHPSVNESLSIVLLEAWLAGTPCLVRASSPVLKYQCERSNGGLWFRNYPDFEESLLLLLDQPDIAARLAAQGQHYVKREYAWEAVEKRLFRALDKPFREDKH